LSVKLKEFYPERDFNARKGDYGRVIIAGGSNRYSGCLAFNSLAALRAGADLAIIVAPERPANIVASYSPDLITIPSRTSYPDPKEVMEALEPADSLIVGCGVERTRSAHDALVSIIRKCTKPMVIDAESLHAIADKPTVVHGKKAVLTPNGGEYKTLTGKEFPETSDEKEKAAKLLAKKFGCTVIVKGSHDYISDGTRVSIDRASSPYMTKGGHGDLLAGVIAAHLARGENEFDAARIGAFIVGRAGELAAKKFGESLLASDVLEFIPLILASKARKEYLV
jgi:NAD(P)H-hydrate epimerase